MNTRDVTQWETSIAQVVSSGDDEDIVIRGRRLSELIGKVTFAEIMFLMLQGQLPSDGQRRVLDALLVASVEHGIAPPSNMEAIRDRVPDARLELFEGGHLFLVQDRTAWPKIVAFLTEGGG